METLGKRPCNPFVHLIFLSNFLPSLISLYTLSCRILEGIHYIQIGCSDFENFRQPAKRSFSKFQTTCSKFQTIRRKGYPLYVLRDSLAVVIFSWEKSVMLLDKRAQQCQNYSNKEQRNIRTEKLIFYGGSCQMIFRNRAICWGRC